MAANDLILEAARAIRPHLQQLAGERATTIDEELAALLSPSQRSDVTDGQLLAVLSADPATQAWTAAFLEHGLPQDLAEQWEKSVQELPGHGEPVIAARYICPDEDYVWYQRAVGQPIPTCPTHGVAPVRAQRAP